VSADPTGTAAGHPALVTATGPATSAPAPTGTDGVDPTGTAAQHPALVSRAGPAAQAAA
jgi:hypothetical protein